MGSARPARYGLPGPHNACRGSAASALLSPPPATRPDVLPNPGPPLLPVLQTSGSEGQQRGADCALCWLGVAQPPAGQRPCLPGVHKRQDSWHHARIREPSGLHAGPLGRLDHPYPALLLIVRPSHGPLFDSPIAALAAP